MNFVHPQTEPIRNSCFPMDIQQDKQQGEQQDDIEKILENLKNLKF